MLPVGVVMKYEIDSRGGERALIHWLIISAEHCRCPTARLKSRQSESSCAHLTAGTSNEDGRLTCQQLTSSMPTTELQQAEQLSLLGFVLERTSL